ncbi:hypothetical protein C0J52_09861 [Blattella germanica]|nr:hypothetical protein C0J52_09861 [Blattella germanica]
MGRRFTEFTWEIIGEERLDPKKTISHLNKRTGCIRSSIFMFRMIELSAYLCKAEYTGRSKEYQILLGLQLTKSIPVQEKEEAIQHKEEED